METNTTSHDAKQHVIGFILSIVLTLAAYFIVVEHLLTGLSMTLALGSLAILQALIQLIFFLDLGKEPKPRWHLIHFLFMVLVLVILVAGSMWIMHHLDYNMMPTTEMDAYMHHQEGL